MKDNIRQGDLVKIEKHCRGKGRLAHVIAAPDWSKSCVQIQFLDEKGLMKERPIWAQKTNLVLMTLEKEKNK